MPRMSGLGEFHVAASLATIILGLIAIAALLLAVRATVWMTVAIAATIVTDLTAHKDFGLAASLCVLSIAALITTLTAAFRKPVGLAQPAASLAFAAAAYINVLNGLISAFQFLPWLRPHAEPFAVTPLTFTAFAAAFNDHVFASAQTVLVLVFASVAALVARIKRLSHG